MKMFEILEEEIQFQRNLDRQNGKTYSRERVFFFSLFSWHLPSLRDICTYHAVHMMLHSR